MKIRLSDLRRIIKEEVGRVLEENDADAYKKYATVSAEYPAVSDLLTKLSPEDVANLASAVNSKDFSSKVDTLSVGPMIKLDIKNEFLAHPGTFGSKLQFLKDHSAEVVQGHGQFWQGYQRLDPTDREDMYVTRAGGPEGPIVNTRRRKV